MTTAQLHKEKSDDYLNVVQLSRETAKRAIEAVSVFAKEKPVATILREKKSQISKVLDQMTAEPDRTAVRVGYNMNGAFMGEEKNIYSLNLYHKETKTVDIISLIVDEKSTQLVYAKGIDINVLESVRQEGGRLTYQQFG